MDPLLRVFGLERCGLGSTHRGNIPLRSGLIRFHQNKRTGFDPVACGASRVRSWCYDGAALAAGPSSGGRSKPRSDGGGGASGRVEQQWLERPTSSDGDGACGRAEQLRRGRRSWLCQAVAAGPVPTARPSGCGGDSARGRAEELRRWRRPRLGQATPRAALELQRASTRRWLSYGGGGLEEGSGVWPQRAARDRGRRS